MQIVCWNINNFRDDKYNRLNEKRIIDHILKEFDVAVILEGPREDGGDLASKVALALPGDHTGHSADTSALEMNECESVLVIAKNDYTITNLATYCPENFPEQNRPPVIFTVEGESHVDEGAFSWGIMAWHAPPAAKGNERAQAWNRICNGIKTGHVINETDLETLDLIMGDFNADVTSPHLFNLETPANGCTSISNVIEVRRMMGADEDATRETRPEPLRTPFTICKAGNHYDRIFRSVECPVSDARVVDVVQDVWRNLNLSTGSATRPKETAPRWRDAQEIVRKVSDHLPVAIKV